MSTWPQIAYTYDGSFAGFLCCLWDSFEAKLYPFYFFTHEENQETLYPLRPIATDQELAKRCYAGLKQKLSPQARQLVEYGFLTCLPRKERHLYDYLHISLFVGPLNDLTDDRVLILHNAVRQLGGEAHLLEGFTRFSDYAGVLVGEITPKNRVLPLLRRHFCLRLRSETFLLYDRTHKEALCYEKGQSRLIPLEDITLDNPDKSEQAYRTLWRQFYDTIAIKERENPKLRMGNMPKRYWENMTEFQ